MTALHSAVTKKNKYDQIVAMVVEPTEEFQPSNWQDTPRAYRIVQLAGNKKHRGDADAWRFLFNPRRNEKRPSQPLGDLGILEL